MAQNTAEQTSHDEAVALGKAVASLRERLGVSQEELADRMGVARQTLSRYESGRPAILRTDLQRKIAEALGVGVEALMDELDNLVFPEFGGRRVDAAPPPRLTPQAQAAPERRIRTTVPIQAQPELRDDGSVHYVEVPPLSSEDLGWLFGPNAGFIRLADGALPDGLGATRFAGYDKTAWPRRGQGCVIETREGELLPRVYERRTEAGLIVRNGSETEPETIPATVIKGVYAIRFYGD